MKGPAMTQPISRDDIALYVMGAYDGDVAALEARIAEDDAAREMLAEEAALELSLRDAATAGTFCPSCDDLVADTTEPKRCSSCGAAVAPGGYHIERVLVANAHGRMYVARDADGTKVALKELAFVQSPSTQTIGAFEREAKFLRALAHPAIPRFRAAFEEGTGVHTRYYLAQELVEGMALDKRLDDHFYSESEIVDIARQVLGVLVYLQGLSPMVIHRDIKPANLIVRADGKVAVVDFGAAHVQGTTAGSTSIGTFGYMPVEQLAGQVDATTDTYALGASLIHLLTRREPWRVFGPKTFESINVSPALQQFLATCVAPEPKDRFANAAAALTALDAPAKVVALTPRASRLPRAAWRVAAGMLAAALALGGAGIAGYALRGAPDPAPVVPSQNDDKNTGDHDGNWDDFDFPAATWPENLDRFRQRTESLRSRLLENARADMERQRDMLLHYDPSAPTRKAPRFTNMSEIDLDFKGAPLPAVLRTIGAGCNLNLVIPSYLKASVTLKASRTPCNEIFESILEAHGFDYVFDAKANLARIAPRNDLVREREEAVQRTRFQREWPIVHELPVGPVLQLDHKDADLRSVLEELASSNKVNLVMPDYVRGQVTILAKDLPWTSAIGGVLAAQGLGYRYRPDGRILRIGPQKDLDREDEEAAAGR
ncbi:MAG: protein kinase domain-containing protein [Kofleriaceae bacterium]